MLWRRAPKSGLALSTEASPPTDASGARQGRGAFKNVEEWREAGLETHVQGDLLTERPQLRRQRHQRLDVVPWARLSTAAAA